MIKRWTFTVFILFLFFSCTREKPNIRVACDMTSSGYYLIKWETFPPMDGTVKIYESSSPDSFKMAYPIVEVDIKKGFADILAIRNLNRSYFKLIFDNNYSVVTSERIIPLPQLYNFRDLGGYYNEEGKQTRWGKIYRSSSIAHASLQDMAYMNNLGIKTIIDFRNERESFDYPCRYRTENSYNLPLRGSRISVFADKILSGQMMRNDVILRLQDAHSFLLENNPDYYIKLFDILLEESNYPLVFYCSLGKDRSGLAAALILLALDISKEQIISDFMLSNEAIDFYNLFPNAAFAPISIQETMTALYSANRETITYAFENIMKEYDTVDLFFEKEFNLTPKKRERLKELLLY